MARLRTRAQWAARIRAAHKGTVGAILKLGRTLIAAKKALAHGEFLKMIEHDLPFTASVAQRLMKIAADPKISNAARAQLLPPAWGTVYELTKLPAAVFEQAASTRTIHPKMTRKDASELVRTIVPIYGRSEQPLLSLPPSLRADAFEAESLPLRVGAALEKLEQAVKNLSMEEIPAEAEKRIRIAAATLLSLIGRDRESLN